MGTRFELVLPGHDEPRLRAAGESALEAIEEVHATFTRFEATSLLAHLRRRAPEPLRLSRPDFEIFAAAEEIRRATAGVFDVCQGGSGALVVGDGRVWVTSPDTELDFGAIAKGFGVDRAVSRLRDAGIASAFLHGGTSSIYGLGRRPDGTRWRVALGGRAEPIIELENEGMAMAAAFTNANGRSVPHLRAGRNGPVVTSPRRAVAVGPSAGWADGWATAATLLGSRPAAAGAEWRVMLQCDPDPWTTLRDAA